jgi:hypothetical protein
VISDGKEAHHENMANILQIVAIGKNAEEEKKEACGKRRVAQRAEMP